MFLTNPALLTYAIEATEGTAPSTGYIPLMVVADPEWSPMEGESVASELVLPYQTGDRQFNIRLNQTFAFRVYLCGSGTAGTAPNWGGLLPACKATETVVTSTSTTYTSAVSTASSVTLRWTLAGVNGTSSLVHQMSGAKGSWSITMNSDELPYIDFSFTGLYTPVTDGSAIPATTYTNQAPALPVGSSASFTVNSVSNCLQSFQIDSGNDVQFSSRAGCTPRILIVNSKPSGSLTMEQKTMAAQAVNVLSTSGLTYPIAISHPAGGTGNTVAFNVSAASFGRASYGRGGDGLLLRTMPFNATGASPWSLVLT